MKYMDDDHTIIKEEFSLDELVDIKQEDVEEIEITAKMPIKASPYSHSFIDEYQHGEIKNEFVSNVNEQIKTEHNTEDMNIMEKFSCNLCNYGTQIKRNLTRHTRKHFADNYLKCDLCNHQTYRKDNLESQYSKDTSCVDTNDKTNLTNILKKQEEGMHKEQKVFHNNFCNYKTRHKTNTIIHQNVAIIDKRDFQCDICNYKTIHKENLETHRKTHTKEMNFRCNLCNFETHYKNSFINHAKAHAAVMEFLCEYKAVSKDDDDLRARDKEHSDRKNFHYCDVCNFKTKRKYNLQIHTKMHAGISDLQCNVCNYQTRYAENLRRHKRRHSKEKNFCCSLCDYRTRYKFSLIKHAKSHAGESSASILIE